MILERARVELLRVVGHGNSEKIAPGAFSSKTAQTFEPGIRAAQMNIEAQGRGVALDRSRVDLDRERFLVPVLGADVIELRAAPGHEIVYAASEPCAVVMSGTEMFDDGDLCQLVRDEKSVRENGRILTMKPVENLDRQFDFLAFRHINKSSRHHECFVQGRELGGTEHRRLGHEMTAEQVFVLDDGAFERL